MSSPKEQEEVINRVYRKHTGAFFESKHCKIFGKDRKAGLITPRQNYLQRKAQKVIDRFEDLDLPVRMIWLKPRQRGSTTYGCAIGYTNFRRNATSGVIIGGQVSQVDEAWAMYQTYQKNDTLDWKNTGEINSKAGVWSNGSRLIRETAGDAKAGIGGTHQFLHCFEAARWAEGVNNSAEVLTNILKCVPLLPGTTILLESTAEGQTGAFYDHWISAIDADDFISGKIEVKRGQFVRVFAPWFVFDDSAVPLTDQEKRDIESTLDEDPMFAGERDLIEMYAKVDGDGVTRLGDVITERDVWEQLAWRRWAIENECERRLDKFERDYPHSWRTAFQKSGAQRFNVIMLEKMRRNLAKARPQNGVISIDKRTVGFRQTTEGESTHTIYEKPIAGCRYLLAADVMTGESQVSGQDPDRHGVFVLRNGYWDASRVWRRACTAARVVQCRWDIDILESSGVWPLARYYGGGYGGCKIAVEVNMDRGLIELLKLRGADLYVREFFNQRENRPSKALGYQTNVKTREKLIEKLAAMIRDWDRDGDGLDIWCPHALEQCENFVRKANGRSEHADGWHDDDVLALALGAELIEHATPYHPQQNIYALPPDLRGEERRGRAHSAFT